MVSGAHFILHGITSYYKHTHQLIFPTRHITHLSNTPCSQLYTCLPSSPYFVWFPLDYHRPCDYHPFTSSPRHYSISSACVWVPTIQCDVITYRLTPLPDMSLIIQSPLFCIFLAPTSQFLVHLCYVTSFFLHNTLLPGGQDIPSHSYQSDLSYSFFLFVV